MRSKGNQGSNEQGTNFDSEERPARLFERSRRLGRDAIIASLRAEANGGIPALFAAPTESSLWYVPFPDDYLTTLEAEQSFREVARDVVKWTNELIAEEQERLLTGVIDS